MQVHIRAFTENDLIATRAARTRAGNVRAKYPVLADVSDPGQASRDARVLSDVSSR
jgi:hypothetical protein